MSLNVKPFVTAQKNARGRVSGYLAEVGPVRALATTKAEAVAQCEESLRDALARLDEGPSYWTAWGSWCVVCPGLTGWVYKVGPCQGHCEASTRAGAINSALVHLGQYMWSKDEDDAAFILTQAIPDDVKRDLAKWIGFQRAYLAAPEDARDKHWWVCEHAEQYAPKVEP